jgi:putative hydrolase of the HAD superfamily
MFCERYKKKWDIELESEIRNLGFSVFKFPPELYEDTILVLQRLRNYGTLILYTNGDEEIQKSKIESLGKRFKSYFTKIYITAMKTEEELKEILREVDMPAGKSWVVGNSVKSDINPAVKLGLQSILIPRGTWQYEESEFLPNDVIVASTLTEAAEIIEHGEIVDRRSRTTK